MLTEATDTVTVLVVELKSIADLTGIEALIALRELSCGLNPLLDSLYVSQNTGLTVLNCSANGINQLEYQKWK